MCPTHVIFSSLQRLHSPFQFLGLTESLTSLPSCLGFGEQEILSGAFVPLDEASSVADNMLHNSTAEVCLGRLCSRTLVSALHFADHLAITLVAWVVIGLA